MAVIQSIARRIARKGPSDEVVWAPCRAPYVALRFSPTGVVRACCANDKVALGTVGVESLREIWEGRPVRELAEALDGGDYGHGCTDCAPNVVTDRAVTPAANFDRFPRQERSGWPLRLEFALSNRCNLQCVMCNGELSSAVRSQREGRPPVPNAYGEEFYQEIEPFLLNAVETAFIGGEPFLEPGCRRIWDLISAQEHRPSVHVTTNGTIGGERVERLVNDLQMSIDMSIDAVTPETFEALRPGASYAEVIANRDRFLAITRANGRSFAVNFCLMTNNWQELHLMVLEADRIDVPLQVIPVLYPAAFSLFCLPDADLRPVLHGLERTEAEVGHRFGRNRLAWDVALDLVRAHLRQADRGEVPVELRVRQVEHQEPGYPWTQFHDLAAWSGHPTIEVSAGDSVPMARLAGAVGRWLGRPTLVLVHPEGLDHGWHGEFSSMTGPVTLRMRRQESSGTTVIALDRDPAGRLPTEVSELLADVDLSDLPAEHESRVAEEQAALRAAGGLDPIRLDVADGLVVAVRLPTWLPRGVPSTLVGSPIESIVLPGTDGVPQPVDLEATRPLVSAGLLAIAVGNRTIGGAMTVIDRRMVPGLTVLIAPEAGW